MRAPRKSQIDWEGRGERLRYFVARGFTSAELAQLFDCTPDAIKSAAKRMGISLLANSRDPLSADREQPWRVCRDREFLDLIWKAGGYQNAHIAERRAA